MDLPHKPLTAKDAAERKLAAALRANLAKRKHQLRGRQADPAPTTVTPEPKPDTKVQEPR